MNTELIQHNTTTSRPCHPRLLIGSRPPTRTPIPPTLPDAPSLFQRPQRLLPLLSLPVPPPKIFLIHSSLALVALDHNPRYPPQHVSLEPKQEEDQDKHDEDAEGQEEEEYCFLRVHVFAVVAHACGDMLCDRKRCRRCGRSLLVDVVLRTRVLVVVVVQVNTTPLLVSYIERQSLSLLISYSTKLCA